MNLTNLSKNILKKNSSFIYFIIETFDIDRPSLQYCGTQMLHKKIWTKKDTLQVTICSLWMHKSNTHVS